MLNKGWKQWLNLKFESGTVLIVDEAQPSYWTSHSGSNYKISTQTPHAAPSFLSSYEGAGHNIYDPMTPFHISPQQNIGLVPVDHGDQIAVGLFLTKAEFDEVVPKLFQNHQFDVRILVYLALLVVMLALVKIFCQCAWFVLMQ